MYIQKKSNNMVEITAEGENILHRIGSENYPEIRRIITPNPSEWEEIAVTDIPLYTKAEYDAKVAELVREKYTADEEFALQRKMLNVIMSPDTISADGSASKALEEYQAYNTYVQECKQRAKDPKLYAKDEQV